MLRTPVFVPVAVGVNVTLIRQLLPGGRSAPQLFCEIAKSAASVPVMDAPIIGMSMFTVDWLWLVRVAVFGPLVMPIGSLPKSRLEGDKVEIVAQAERLTISGLKKPSVDGLMVTAPLMGPRILDGVKVMSRLQVPAADILPVQPLLRL
jgi:hypothetical protein